MVGYKVSYGLLLLAGMSGLVLTRARWQELFPYYLLFGSLTLVYSVFFIHTRYRMLLEPFLMLFAAYSLCHLLAGRRRCRDSGDIPGSVQDP